MTTVCRLTEPAARKQAIKLKLILLSVWVTFLCVAAIPGLLVLVKPTAPFLVTAWMDKPLELDLRWKVALALLQSYLILVAVYTAYMFLALFMLHLYAVRRALLR